MLRKVRRGPKSSVKTRALAVIRLVTLQNEITEVAAKPMFASDTFPNLTSQVRITPVRYFLLQKLRSCSQIPVWWSRCNPQQSGHLCLLTPALSWHLTRALWNELHSTTEESHSWVTTVETHAWISQALTNTPAHTHANLDVQYLPAAWQKTHSVTLHNKDTASKEGNL